MFAPLCTTLERKLLDILPLNLQQAYQQWDITLIFKHTMVRRHSEAAARTLSEGERGRRLGRG